MKIAIDDILDNHLNPLIAGQEYCDLSDRKGFCFPFVSMMIYRLTEAGRIQAIQDGDMLGHVFEHGMTSNEDLDEPLEYCRRYHIIEYAN